jgi:hypothetical protein
LHLAVIQSARVGEHSQRISRERYLREDIKLNEFVSAARHKKTCQRVPEKTQDELQF